MFRFVFVCAVLVTFVVSSEKNITIGAFNIQSFGKTKYSRTAIRGYLVDIVTKYDVILIQEIKEKAQTMIWKFLADCQAVRSTYDMALSIRLGRTTRYMEQYAIIYDTSLVTMNNHTVYSDPSDVFHREPIVAEISLVEDSSKKLTLVGVHTDPDDVPEELGEMDNVYTWAVQQGFSPNCLMMGDLNADCSYLTVTETQSLSSLYRSSNYNWMIGRDADTTVSTKTDCAYDRFISRGSSKFANTEIDRFDQWLNLTEAVSKKVSDHYPIRTIWIAA